MLIHIWSVGGTFYEKYVIAYLFGRGASCVEYR